MTQRIQVPEGTTVSVQGRYGLNIAKHPDWLVVERGIEDREDQKTIHVIPDESMQRYTNQIT